MCRSKPKWRLPAIVSCHYIKVCQHYVFYSVQLGLRFDSGRVAGRRDGTQTFVCSIILSANQLKTFILKFGAKRRPLLRPTYKESKQQKYNYDTGNGILSRRNFINKLFQLDVIADRHSQQCLQHRTAITSSWNPL
jgi:hypothetical protein